jgi:hypothetical protein
LIEASDELVRPDAVEWSVVEFLNQALEKARSFSANLEELRMGFRADIAAALEPHWFEATEFSHRRDGPLNTLTIILNTAGKPFLFTLATSTQLSAFPHP